MLQKSTNLHVGFVKFFTQFFIHLGIVFIATSMESRSKKFSNSCSQLISGLDQSHVLIHEFVLDALDGDLPVLECTEFIMFELAELVLLINESICIPFSGSTLVLIHSHEASDLHLELVVLPVVFFLSLLNHVLHVTNLHNMITIRIIPDSNEVVLVRQTSSQFVDGRLHLYQLFITYCNSLLAIFHDHLIVVSHHM